MNLFQIEFVQNAFIAGSIVAVLTAIVGYFVVLRVQAFAGDALAHIGFAGATGAAVLGIASLIGTYFFTLLGAIGMGALGERVRGRDLEIGMVLSFALGLGVLFLNLYTSFATEAVGVLFGSILSVTRSDVGTILITSIVMLLILGFIFRPLLFSSIDPEVALARGVPVRALSIGFMLLLAITVAEAIQVVGVLLVFALLIAPAATAQKVSHEPLSTIGLSILFGLLFTWCGLLLAFFTRLPVSFYISVLAALSYLVVMLLTRLRTPYRYKAPPHPSRECKDPTMIQPPVDTRPLQEKVL
ncbi:MAG TPA: metal ABC transporter permease [Ktedonobacteraceae bacterium]|nr:metal ABC transporter permease [Ktedonobacteraceae bacterium]